MSPNLRILSWIILILVTMFITSTDKSVVSAQAHTNGHNRQIAPERIYNENLTVAQPSNDECGDWQSQEPSSEEDPHIQVSKLEENLDINCRGTFQLTNNTKGIFGTKGYTLELVYFSDGAEVSWTLLPQGNQISRKIALIPQLKATISAEPLFFSAAATVVIEGSVTAFSQSQDISLYILTETLSQLTPPGVACLIPEETMAFISLQASEALNSTVELLLKGDTKGAREEFRQVAPDFYERVIDAANETEIADVIGKDILQDCGFDALGIILGKPAELFLLAGKTWIVAQVYINTIWLATWNYSGNPAQAVITYTPCITDHIVTIPVSEDTWVSPQDTSPNGHRENLLLGRAGSDEKNTFKILLKFNVNDYIPHGASIKEANVILYPVSASGDFIELSFSIYPLKSEWAEYFVVDSSLPQYHGDITTEAFMTLSGDTKEFPITNIVEKWLNNEIENHGLLLWPRFAIMQSRILHSREATTGSAPELVVTYEQNECISSDNYVIPIGLTR